MLPGLAHRTVRCATEQCPVHQGASARTLHLRVSQAHLRYNSPDCPVSHRTVSGAPPDCPVHQRSNDYLRATVDSDREQCSTVNAAEVRAVGQRGTGLFGATPDCPVPHEDKASNGRLAPSPNGRMTWRHTGHFSNSYILVGGYKYHPNQPLQGVGAQATFQVI